MSKSKPTPPKQMVNPVRLSPQSPRRRPERAVMEEVRMGLMEDMRLGCDGGHETGEWWEMRQGDDEGDKTREWWRRWDWRVMEMILELMKDMKLVSEWGDKTGEWWKNETGKWWNRRDWGIIKNQIKGIIQLCPYEDSTVYDRGSLIW